MSLGCDSNTKYTQYRIHYFDINDSEKHCVFFLSFIKSYCIELHAKTYYAYC